MVRLYFKDYYPSPHLHKILFSTYLLCLVYPFLFLCPAIPIIIKIILVLALSSLLAYTCTLPKSITDLNQISIFSLFLSSIWPLMLWISCYTLILNPKWLLTSNNQLKVDTTTLPAIDTYLVNQPAYLYFMPKSNNEAYLLLDLVAWFIYGILHFISPIICLLILLINQFFYASSSYHLMYTLLPTHHQFRTYWHTLICTRLRHVHTFLVCFGSINLCGVLVQYVFPTAPPWYYLKHGSNQPEYPYFGDPAGLARIDKFLDTPVYANLFRSSPIVFGAFPSLHAGFATIVCLVIWRALPKQIHLWTFSFPKLSGKLGQWTICLQTWVFGLVYVMLVWWATMYLCHHYLVDVIGGSFLSGVIFYIVCWKS